MAMTAHGSFGKARYKKRKKRGKNKERSLTDEWQS
ncbi:hypothetical protein EE612_002857 [Oryza sativa]|nr:hypothetical protein EE612_002857 [Oryza sativa]